LDRISKCTELSPLVRSTCDKATGKQKQHIREGQLHAAVYTAAASTSQP
jgi:hypothetical protein